VVEVVGVPHVWLEASRALAQGEVAKAAKLTLKAEIVMALRIEVDCLHLRRLADHLDLALDLLL